MQLNFIEDILTPALISLIGFTIGYFTSMRIYKENKNKKNIKEEKIDKIKPYEFVEELRNIQRENILIMEHESALMQDHKVEIPFIEFCNLIKKAEKIEGTQISYIINLKSGKVKCESCGAVLEDLTNFCPQCGDKLKHLRKI